MMKMSGNSGSQSASTVPSSRANAPVTVLCNSTIFFKILEFFFLSEICPFPHFRKPRDISYLDEMQLSSCFFYGQAALYRQDSYSVQVLSQ